MCQYHHVLIVPVQGGQHKIRCEEVKMKKRLFSLKLPKLISTLALAHLPLLHLSSKFREIKQIIMGKKYLESPSAGMFPTARNRGWFRGGMFHKFHTPLARFAIPCRQYVCPRQSNSNTWHCHFHPAAPCQPRHLFSRACGLYWKEREVFL